MFGELLGGMIDKEKAISITIKSALESVSEELGCKPSDFFIMIMPSDEKMNFKNYIYRIENGKPTRVREISLKEIIGD